MTLRPHPFRLALAIAVTGIAASAAWAQSTTTTVRGVVRDAAGTAVGDVLVEVTDLATGAVARASSDADGRYAVYGLRAGSHRLTVTAASRPPATREVQLLFSGEATVDLVLAEDQVLTTVAGEAVDLLTGTDGTAIATPVSPQQLATLPQDGRDFLDLTVLAPGVLVSLEPLAMGGGFRSGAADSRQTNVFIDGESYKGDILLGGAFMNEGSRGNPFPANAVQEYRVLTQSYGPEYGKSAAAVVSAITRRGGNDWRGDAFYQFQDDGFVSHDDIAEERGAAEPEYEREQYGLALGGPLRRDVAHFFVSWEGHQEERFATVTRGEEYAQLPQNVRTFLDRFPTGTLSAPFDSDLYFGKLSWSPGGGHDVQATYHGRDEQEIRNFGDLRTRDGAESLEISTDALVGRHQWVRGDLRNELTLGWQQQEWNPGALEPGSPRLSYISALDVGGYSATQRFTQDRLSLRDDVATSLTWFGDHSLTAGLSYARVDASIEKQNFSNGIYVFAAAEQWQFPFLALLGVGDPSVELANDQWGVYLQDDWQVLERLTVNLGVRWDYETNMLAEEEATPAALVGALESACRTYGEPVGGQSTWCLRDFLDVERYTTDGDDRDDYTGMVQPRVGFSWDARGDGRTVVFGAWGTYYDRVVANDVFDAQYRQQYATHTFCFSADGAPSPSCGPAIAWRPEYLTAEGLASILDSSRVSGSEVFLVDDEMRPPRTDQWSLGVRQRLGGWLAALAYGNVETSDNLLYFFGDLPPGTAFEDRFGGNVGVPGYARVFVTTTAASRWYEAIYLTLDHPLTADGRWGFDLSYTYAEGERDGIDNASEGVAFGAFDYPGPEALYRFPDTYDERHRLVMSGTWRAPWNFLVSSLVTLGSGRPYTIFDNSGSEFTVRWNEGRPEQHTFLGWDNWAYRSVDLRLEWTAPAILGIEVTLIGEGFNVFDYDNYVDFDSSKPRPPQESNLGEPLRELDTRRYQLGARLTF
jgi:hypothetical protein